MISANESLEGAMSAHLPAGDNLSTTLSSPQFSQALSMFWSALQSGQVAPVIQQFGLGSRAVNAAASGNIEEFVTALESEAKSQQTTTGAAGESSPATASSGKQSPTDKDKATTEQSKGSSKTTDNTEKRNDDDDEGMALD